ncbi:MAG: heme anaerobic degradation radical SAM methyltransferase ChuW/HutW [Deltaproteobacteria bacterium]|nr:MAG: heme anaerobic degradation radical SAM methyltransferase ChuW/HutW [Deltaproteobacteria bacterium]
MIKPHEAFSADTPSTAIEAYYARETGDPLFDAFPEKITVHPGGKSAPVAKDRLDATYAELMQQPRTGKTAAYIHVPFCESHCLYCGFYRKRYDEAQSRHFTDALISELRATADTPYQNNRPVQSVYIGGGTPTSLEAADLQRLLLAINENLPLSNDCEITVEGRIWNFGPEKMEACIAGGANRFSIGVQTFDTKLRQTMKRLADRDTVISALSRLRDYDEAAVIMDLIYGFPTQTMAMWEDDIRTLLDLKLEGVDLYQLNIFPATPLYKAIEKGKLPDGIDQSNRARMYARGIQLMDDAMYKRLTVNHWGRTSRERNIYNHMMKSPADCMAFGPGAGGSIHGHFFMLETDYEKWRTTVQEDGRKPILMMQTPNPNAVLEKTITAEMELCRINLKQLEADFNLPIASVLTPLYDQWARAGLIEKKGDWSCLTTAGQFWQVNLAQFAINYLHHTLLKEDS